MEITLQNGLAPLGFMRRTGDTCPGLAVRWLAEVDSTSSQLRRELTDGALRQPTLLCTDRQTAGRGTRGRDWVQPARQAGRDLALTLALPLSERWQHEPRLSLLLGAQLALAIEGACSRQFGLKWPNDLLLEHGGAWRKCGGLLLETLPAADGARWLLCGLGLNLNSRAADFPTELQPQLTTLRDALGVAVDREEVHTAVTTALYALLCAADPPDTAGLLTEWARRDRTGGAAYVLTRDGQRIAVTAAGADLDTGALRVRQAAGTETLVHSFTELEPA